MAIFEGDKKLIDIIVALQIHHNDKVIALLYPFCCCAIFNETHHTGVNTLLSILLSMHFSCSFVISTLQLYFVICTTSISSCSYRLTVYYFIRTQGRKKIFQVGGAEKRNRPSPSDAARGWVREGEISPPAPPEANFTFCMFSEINRRKIHK